MYRSRRQKRRGNQQRNFLYEEVGGCEYQKQSVEHATGGCVKWKTVTKACKVEFIIHTHRETESKAKFGQTEIVEIISYNYDRTCNSMPVKDVP